VDDVDRNFAGRAIVGEDGAAHRQCGKAAGGGERPPSINCR
jgi:hypothetical protein